MSNISKTPFGTFAPIYHNLGFWARPLTGKVCNEKNWQLPDNKLPEGLFEQWLEYKAAYNIGIVAGSLFPDSTRLGFLDIDHDQFTNLGKVLLHDPLCVRYGSKGAVIPFRYPDGLTLPNKEKINTKADFEKEEIAELFFSKAYCAAPPSIHPDIKQPYRWEGPALHEIDYNLLPLIGE